MPSPYPVAPAAEVADELHGRIIADPYRPLEDPDDPATVAWVAAENEVTDSFLSGVRTRADIRARVAELWDYPKKGVPFQRGSRWFQLRNTGLQAQSVLFTGRSADDEGRVLIDPNLLSDDGTVSLTGMGFSDDGGRLAWATSTGGSDWMTWRVRDIETGSDLDDVVEWSKFSGAAWSGDGFFYSAMDPPAPGTELTATNLASWIAYHRIADPQSEDEVVFAAPEHPDWVSTAAVTEDQRFLVVTAQVGTGTETYVLVRDLSLEGSKLEPLNPVLDAGDHVVEHAGDGSFYVQTDRRAERGRVVQARPGQTPDEWVEVIAEAGDTLNDVRFYAGHLVCHYLRDARSIVSVHGADGTRIREIPLPDPVSVVEISGRIDSDLIFFSVSSFTRAGEIWSHDLRSGQTTLVSSSSAPLSADHYVTEQVFVESGDGTPVPMFLTRSRSARPTGDGRVLLYGYGGFNVPLTPSFSVTYAAWLDRGGMLAVANLRGGGEYGRAWHDAGRLTKKQNVFDDFAACARWLSSSGWSRPDRIAVMGGSNGGLLVGATLTQHPELIGAALAEVGVMDMLRFHLFTIGWAWKSDYGDPGDPDQFRTLLAYSPLHNIAPGRCYPPTLIMTGDHDDRVVPAHSYKFAAALQAAQGCDQPVLLRVTTSGGHGAGKPTSKLIDEAADRLAFLEYALG